MKDRPMKDRPMKDRPMKDEGGTKDGRIRPMTDAELDALTDAEIAAAVAADPDAAPVRSEEELEAARARELERDIHGVLRLRRRLGLGQIDFASRYKIPLGTLRNWEQGRAAPDQSAKVLLAAIAADPEGVARAAEHAGDPAYLAGGPRRAA